MIPKYSSAMRIPLFSITTFGKFVKEEPFFLIIVGTLVYIVSFFHVLYEHHTILSFL